MNDVCVRELSRVCVSDIEDTHDEGDGSGGWEDEENADGRLRDDAASVSFSKYLSGFELLLTSLQSFTYCIQSVC